jgi:hypothetical protein
MRQRALVLLLRCISPVMALSCPERMFRKVRSWRKLTLQPAHLSSRLIKVPRAALLL